MIIASEERSEFSNLAEPSEPHSDALPSGPQPRAIILCKIKILLAFERLIQSGAQTPHSKTLARSASVPEFRKVVECVWLATALDLAWTCPTALE